MYKNDDFTSITIYYDFGKIKISKILVNVIARKYMLSGSFVEIMIKT